MVHQLVSPAEMEEQKRLFARLDVNQDGMLQRDELVAGFKEIYGTVCESELDEIMAIADLNGNGELDFTEWLVATAKRESLLTEHKLRQAFQYFNKSGTG